MIESGPRVPSCSASPSTRDQCLVLLVFKTLILISSCSSRSVGEASWSRVGTGLLVGLEKALSVPGKGVQVLKPKRWDLKHARDFMGNYIPLQNGPLEED